MIRLVYVIAAIVFLSACSSGKLDGAWQGVWDDKTLSGVYRPDLSQMPDSNERNMLKAMDVRLEFADKVEMKVSFLGRSRTRELLMTIKDGNIRLAPKGSQKPVLLKRTDNYTLECIECPKGFPRKWKKPEPSVYVLKFESGAPGSAALSISNKGKAGETLALTLKYEKQKIGNKEKRVVVLAPAGKKNVKPMILVVGRKALTCHQCPKNMPKTWKKD